MTKLSPHNPHPPPHSPSGRGREQQPEPEQWTEARYRVAASKVMVQIARELRQRETLAEVVLWETLRNRRLANLKFRRQHSIANTAFVADFICYEHRLVIELDGGIHQGQTAKDSQRQQGIEDAGYRVIRFQNDEVFDNLEHVLIAILHACDVSPLAMRERGRG